jgi:hypothetical protein
MDNHSSRGYHLAYMSNFALIYTSSQGKLILNKVWHDVIAPWRDLILSCHEHLI